MSSSGEENCPVVLMRMFLIQEEPNWNLWGRTTTEDTHRLASLPLALLFLLPNVLVKSGPYK